MEKTGEDLTTKEHENARKNQKNLTTENTEYTEKKMVYGWAIWSYLSYQLCMSH